MLSHIGDLEGDGDANADSQPNETIPEAPKIVQRFKNDAEDTPEEPTEDSAKSDEVPTNPNTSAEDETPKDQQPKEGMDTQENDAPKEGDIKENSSNEGESLKPTEEKTDLPNTSTAEEELRSSMLDVNGPASSGAPKDEGNSERDIPERPKPEAEAEKTSGGSEEAPKGSLLDGVDPSTIDKGEEKHNVEPSHPEAQESPEAEQDSTPAQTSDAPKGSLLDGAEPSQAEEVEKNHSSDDKGMFQSLYHDILARVHDFFAVAVVSNILYLLRFLSVPVETTTDEKEVAPKEPQSSHPLAPEEEYDDASMPEPTSDYEEIMGDDQENSKYGESFPTHQLACIPILTWCLTGNQISSKESNEPSRTKKQTDSPLADSLNSAAETVADTRKNLLDTATTSGKDATGSVADDIKDNAPETGKTYTESLTDVVKGVSDKAADLNKSYQDGAIDGTKEGRQGIMGLVDAAVSYIPPLKGDSGLVVDKEKLREQK